ncbi:MAG: HTH-type transcriptional activator IlvY [Deltaproteobacteria bacterium]|nr:HTH-type transcriptional activator IlvY [Deltaproteobacteria bacterium]MBN2670262.1 HTH-type transcriptional activator IlvY [Deltaproteobacteria bacterium]
MNSDDLKSFVAVAQTLHFGKAARIVHLSPSALTRSIQRLEQELNHPLFSRDRRHVELTSSGQTFLKYAEKTLDDWEQCRAMLDGGPGELSGKLSIYSSVTAAHTILQKVLRPFRNQFAKVHVHLATGTAAEAIERVQDKAVDCAVAAMPHRLPKGVRFLPLTSTSLTCIAPLGFDTIPVFSNNGDVDFSRTPFIVPDESGSREQQMRWLKKQHVRPNIYAEVSGNEALIAMVSLGFGIGMVPHIVLTQSPLKNSVRPLSLAPPLDPYAIGVVFSENRRTDPIINGFCNVCRASYEATP